MFTGIIRKIGRVISLQDNKLVIDAGVLAGLGDSIAISGVCLSVTKIDGDNLHFDLASETLRKTKLGSLTQGSRVNLEESAAVGDKIHGHFVQGHVDAVSKVLAKDEEENTLKLTFELPDAIKGLVAPKGSITIDGVSLTVGEVEKDSFSVYIIPLTLEETTLSDLKVGSTVNLEADCLARYVKEILRNG